MDAHLASHPTDQILSSYGLGKLDDASAEAVNDHWRSAPSAGNGSPSCRPKASSAGSVRHREPAGRCLASLESGGPP